MCYANLYNLLFSLRKPSLLGKASIGRAADVWWNERSFVILPQLIIWDFLKYIKVWMKKYVILTTPAFERC